MRCAFASCSSSYDASAPPQTNSYPPTNQPGTETALFVLVPDQAQGHAQQRFLPSFTWEEPQTGMSPWAARPDLHITFVPVSDGDAGRRAASE